MANKPDFTVRQFPGEFSASNPNDVPEGASERLTNCAIRDDGKLEPIRGFNGFGAVPTTPPTSAGVIDSRSFLFSSPSGGANNPTTSSIATNTQLLNLNNVGGAVSLNPAVLSPGTDLGVLDPSSSFVSSTIAMLKTGFINTARGLYKITNLHPEDNLTTTPSIAPTHLTPPGTFDQGTNGVAGCSAIAQNIPQGDSRDWLQVGWSVAYRFVVGVRDRNGYVRYSEPSPRCLATNTFGATTWVQVNVVNPLNLPNFNDPNISTFIQVYRSQSVPPNVVPSDEMFLVTELDPVAGAGPWGFYATWLPGTGLQSQAYVDVTPDTQIYIPLYTNRGLGNGIQAAKNNAPVSNVLFSFGGRAYFGDTSSQQALLVLLTGVSASGLTTGASITIDGVTYTGLGIGSPINQQFSVSTAGTPSQNLRKAGQTICDCVNTYYQYLFPNLPEDKQVVAHYISLGNGDEGQILLRRPVPGSPAFTVKTSGTAGWGRDYTAGVSSDPSAAPGGLYWSDLNQPDAVPLANNVVLGAPQARVVGGVALRDYAIIFKEDGAWSVRESPRGPTFAPLDSTIRLVAPRTAVPLGNECVALTSQGVVSIGEYGVTPLSPPIQREIQGYLNANQGLFKGAFAIGYEAEREYWLALPSGRTQSVADIVKIYNQKTGAWTTSKLGSLYAGVEAPTSTISARLPQTALHFSTSTWASGSTPSGNAVIRERKSFDNTDYQLGQVTPTLTVVGNNYDGTFSFTTSPTWAGVISKGSILRLPAISGAQNSFIVKSASLNAAQTSVVVAVELLDPSQIISNLTGAFIQLALPCTIRSLPLTGNQPLLEKMWDGAGCFIWYRYMNIPAYDVGWETEHTQQQVTSEENGPVAQEWAYDTWSKGVWMRGAQDFVDNVTIEAADVRGAQITHTLYLYPCQSKFEIAAITYNISSVSDRTVR